MAWSMSTWLAKCEFGKPREKSELLLEEYELSEDDDSPTYNLGKNERNLLTNSHKEIHKCIVKLLELQKIDTTMDLLRIFADVFRTPDPADSEGDDPMSTEETASQRLARYRSSEQCEVSDPDEWAVIHYGRDAEETTENEGMEGDQEFYWIFRPTEAVFQVAPYEKSLRWDTRLSSLAIVPFEFHSTELQKWQQKGFWWILRSKWR